MRKSRDSFAFLNPTKLERRNCPGDVNHDGIVDVDDLIAVILNWGACTPGEPATGCLGYVVTAPCGNGAVDVDDLIAVILGWGQCPDGIPVGDPGPLPENVQGCVDSCERKYRPGTAEYSECVGACVQSLYMTP